MIRSATLENVPEDRDFRQIVATFLNDLESFFQRCAASGQREGTIAISHTAEDLARLLLGVLLGIRILARYGPIPSFWRHGASGVRAAERAEASFERLEAAVTLLLLDLNFSLCREHHERDICSANACQPPSNVSV